MDGWFKISAVYSSNKVSVIHGSQDITIYFTTKAVVTFYFTTKAVVTF